MGRVFVLPLSEGNSRILSTDFFVLAKRALEAAIRNENDLAELLPPDPPAASTPRGVPSKTILRNPHTTHR
jgi:hypothetical protein